MNDHPSDKEPMTPKYLDHYNLKKDYWEGWHHKQAGRTISQMRRNKQKQALQQYLKKGIYEE